MKQNWIRPLALMLLCAMLLGGCTGPDAKQAPDTPAPKQTEPEPQPDPAAQYVSALPLEQQVAQLFFARCPDVDAAALAKQYNIGGYILFGRDFDGQTADTVRANIASYQQAAATPMLIGVDEEGGTVVRASANPNIRDGKFRSPQALFADGGMDAVLADAAEKDALLSSLGINVNLAPVCDVSTDPADFINARAFGQDATATAEYIRAVVSQMKQDGMGHALKHFPGYGDNIDTHTGIATDRRTLENFRENDFLPFQAGIEAGADAVLVSHNIMTAVDSELPASLSPAVHALLREELSFDGVIMTDDLIMDAITQYTDGADAAVLAVKAGNDLLISSNFETQYTAVLTAVQNGTLDKAQIAASATRVIRWKMSLGLVPLT